MQQTPLPPLVSDEYLRSHSPISDDWPDGPRAPVTPTEVRNIYEAELQRLRSEKCAHYGQQDAQPSAPTVDQIMEVVRKADKDWHDYYDDEEFWNDLRARLTQLMNP